MKLGEAALHPWHVLLFDARIPLVNCCRATDDSVAALQARPCGWHAEHTTPTDNCCRTDLAFWGGSHFIWVMTRRLTSSILLQAQSADTLAAYAQKQARAS